MSISQVEKAPNRAHLVGQKTPRTEKLDWMLFLVADEEDGVTAMPEMLLKLQPHLT
jgi:hypothetical protein